MNRIYRHSMNRESATPCPVYTIHKDDKNGQYKGKRMKTVKHILTERERTWAQNEHGK